jgi:integrase/recombinase XerC
MAFRSYLLKEKNYSIHTINAYDKDLSMFAGFLLEHFEQDDLTQVNYSQIRSWVVFLIDQRFSPV